MTKHPEVARLAGRFHDQIIEIDRILLFSLAGVKSQISAPQAVEALANYEKIKGNPLPEQEYQNRLKQAEERAKFAASQEMAGFPVLYAHAVVAIWAAIETFVEDLVVHSLLSDDKFVQKDDEKYLQKDDERYLQRECFKKIRILFVEYESLDEEDRMRYLVKELGRQTSAELKHGINRFEPILDAVDLSGPMPDGMRKTCYELWATRNLIAHRSGIVDRRFVQVCPWLGSKVGDLLKVTPQAYKSYIEFAYSWMFEILVRDIVRRGHNRDDAIAKLGGGTGHQKTDE